MLSTYQGRAHTHVLTARRGACAVAARSRLPEYAAGTLTLAGRANPFVLGILVHTPCKRRRHDSDFQFQRTSPLHAGNRQLSSETEANQIMQNFLLSIIAWSWVEWIAAVTIAAGTAAIGYLAYKRFYVKDHRNKAMINLHIQKDNPKIVHAFDMEDLGDKAVYCRCWRSKKFPFCDGSHTKHNEETGDNVGPLIIKKKET
ncbi:CDGSH iron-sulfur domain-containing protein 1 isoform X1 [Saimiri boliviensis]|uniref:CDGSH iron-sulfur domain-containing protein 1 isoform X1 n=2 Tax=Saimiri boliviensis TaxID=27679 RepID=UPI003D772B21